MPERRKMLYRSVPFVPFPSILWILLGGGDHQPVAKFLGENGSSRDTGMESIPANHRFG